MKNREAVYNALEMIECNLKGGISVQDISGKLDFSVYYFSRLFKGVAGISPKTYILHRKITEAFADIRNTEKKIIEIAFEYGFSTPESFSRAFQKITGLNPSSIKKGETFDRNRLLAPITKFEIENSYITEEQEPEIVTLESFILAGIPFLHDFTLKNDLSEQWSILINNISSLHDRIQPEKYFQMQYWFDDFDDDSIFILAAAQVRSMENIPSQFTVKVIPAQKYLKFHHKGPCNRVGKTYQYIYDKWLPESEYRLPYLYNFEFYGKEHKGPYNEESVSEIYIPVKI